MQLVLQAKAIVARDKHRLRYQTLKLSQSQNRLAEKKGEKASGH
jgi:hypothetical protein